MSQSSDHTSSSAITARIKRHVLDLIDSQAWMTERLRRWHEASYRKTLSMAVDGKLSPATLVMRLRHTPDEADRLERLAAVCAAIHTAADLADDCEDDDLNPEIWSATDKPRAINVSSGLLFTVYQAIDSLPITAEQRGRVTQVVTAAGLAMHVGQELDLAATDQWTPADYAQICNLKAGAEFGSFLAIAAIALDRPSESYERLGQSLGALIQAYSDIVDVWLLPTSPDLIAGKQGLPMALGLVVDAAGVRQAAAGDRTRPERQRQLRQVLCQPGVIHLCRQMMAGWIRETREALAACGEEPALAALADEVIGQAEELIDALLEAAPQLSKPSRRGTGPLQLPALTLAEQFLADPRSPQDSIEFQRSGLFNCPELVADVFGPAFVADVLAELGHDMTAVAQALSQRADADGWRYYPHQSEIPPDADDLGQLLLLFSRLGGAAGIRPSTLELALDEALVFCQTKGRLPVWLFTSGTTSPPDSWAGDDCPGAIATGVAGLTALQRPEWQPILTATVEWLLDQRGQDGLWRGFHYFEPHVCTMFVVRCLQAQAAFVPAEVRGRIDCVFADLAQRLAVSQRLDGSWGSPQVTASALATWLMVDPRPAGMAYATTFLAETQEFDGGWRAESLYVTFGQGDRVVTFASRQMTSALCLRALHRAEQRRQMIAAAPLTVPLSLSAVGTSAAEAPKPVFAGVEVPG